MIADGEEGDEKSAKTATQRGRKDKTKLFDKGAEPVNLLDTRTSRQVNALGTQDVIVINYWTFCIKYFEFPLCFAASAGRDRGEGRCRHGG